MKLSSRSLLSFATGLSLITMATSADDPPEDGPDISSLIDSQPTTNAEDAEQEPTQEPTQDPAPETTGDPSPTQDTPTTADAQPTEPPETTEAPPPAPESTESVPEPTTSPTESTESIPTITGDETQPTATETDAIPSITGATTRGHNTIPNSALTGTGVFTILAPSVPPTLNAPYRQQSTLPEGTVFIAVGAILGFFALSVMLWRALVVWSLHRNVKRAAMQQNKSTAKAAFRSPPPPFYQFKDRESTISLGGLGPKSGKKNPRPTTATGMPNQSLFFSPTAGASGVANPGNRASNYLPSGYYASGASQLGNGQGMAHPGTGSPGISLSNLGPSRDGYARTRSVGASPPGSPYLNATIPSSSTVNLSQPLGDQRAPSVFLDDLMDSEAAPPIPGQTRNPSGTRG